MCHGQRTMDHLGNCSSGLQRSCRAPLRLTSALRRSRSEPSTHFSNSSGLKAWPPGMCTYSALEMGVCCEQCKELTNGPWSGWTQDTYQPLFLCTGFAEASAMCRLCMALPPLLSKEARAQWHKLVEGFREPIPMTAISQVCHICPPLLPRPCCLGRTCPAIAYLGMPWFDSLRPDDCVQDYSSTR